jgi:DNA-binding NarL/FixJ family response regulator
MPVLLVVDDSPIYRKLVSELLAKDSDPDWVIESVDSAERALTLMVDLLPNVIVSDLMMQKMDGLEFIKTVRADHPEVPVILITAQDSEGLAIEALERGAASYVPKSHLAARLLDTVKEVLGVAGPDLDYQPLADTLVEACFTVQLTNDQRLITPLVHQFQRLLALMRFGDTTERIHLSLALQEAILNALFHGNLALSGEEVQKARVAMADNQTAELVVKRCAVAPYRDRKIVVQARFSTDEIRLTVRDDGSGFAHQTLPPEADLCKQGRRGLVLMRHFMDRVTFNNEGNEVTLVKRRPTPSMLQPAGALGSGLRNT